MKRWGVALIGAIVVAGCGSPTQAPADGSAATPPPAIRPAVLAHVADCTSDGIRARSSVTTPVRCAFTSPRFPKLTFDFADPGVPAAPARPDRTQRVGVYDGDRLVQTIEETTTSAYTFVPRVKNLANDAFGQLFTVTSSPGEAGQGLTVWRAQSSDGPFVRTGDLVGYIDRIVRLDGRQNAIYASAPQASGVQTIFEQIDNRLVTYIQLPVAPTEPKIDRGWTRPWLFTDTTECLLKTPTDDEIRAMAGVGWQKPGEVDRGLIQSLCQLPAIRDTYGPSIRPRN